MEISSSVPATNLKPAKVECLFSTGSEGRESAVIAYIEKKFEENSRCGLQHIAHVSDGAMLRILGEQEASSAVTPRRRRRKRPFRKVDVSATGPSEVGIFRTLTPVKSVLPIYSQRWSSLLELPAQFDVVNGKKKVEFETGDYDTPPARWSPIAYVIKGNVLVFPKFELLVSRILSLWRVC